MIKFPAPTAMPVPTANMEYARAYVLDQPYTCVASPKEGFKHFTLFPFLLKSYLPGLKKAEEGKA